MPQAQSDRKLGVQKEVAIRLHTFGKALASSRGILPIAYLVRRVETDETKAVILGTETVRSALINFARTIIFTTGARISRRCCSSVFIPVSGN